MLSSIMKHLETGVSVCTKLSGKCWISSSCLSLVPRPSLGCGTCGQLASTCNYNITWAFSTAWWRRRVYEEEGELERLRAKRGIIVWRQHRHPRSATRRPARTRAHACTVSRHSSQHRDTHAYGYKITHRSQRGNPCMNSALRRS